MVPSLSLRPENVGLCEGTELQQLSIRENLHIINRYLRFINNYIIFQPTFHVCSPRVASSGVLVGEAGGDHRATLMDTAFRPAW